MGRWLTRVEEGGGTLRVWNFSRLGRWFCSCFPLLLVWLAATKKDPEWLPISAFICFVTVAGYRFAWAHLDVDEAGMTYHGFWRTRVFPWLNVSGLSAGVDGITVFCASARPTHLMVTKRDRMTSRRMLAQAEDLRQRIVAYAPDKGGRLVNPA